MSEVDIFKSTTPMSGEFFKFAEVGDGVQGTYIDKRTGKDGFNNDQIIYVLKDKDGKIWNAAFRASSVVVHERMKSAKRGYIVGFKFDDWGTVKKGVNAGTKFRIINVYFDSKHVDKDWLKEHPNAETEVTAAPAAEQPATVVVVQGGGASENAEAVRVAMPSMDEEEEGISDSSLEAIRNLAKSKGLATETMFEEEVDALVTGYTGFELSEENVPKIIIKLTSYSK